MSDPEVLTVPEAALKLRISRGSAYEAARRGELPVVRIGRRLLVPKAALERMLAEAGNKGMQPKGPQSGATRWP